MFVGCSEISENVTVKHMQHVGIIWHFVCLRGLIHFFSAWGREKKCWFVVC